MTPAFAYANSGELHIAYSVLGSGPIDLVWCPGATTHLEMYVDGPYWRPMLDRIARFCRLIIFDKRGTGMSDRPVGVATLEERTDDIRAVMEAASSDRAHIFGMSEGGTMACLFAATYPDRTRSLLLWGTRPRWRRAPDYPWGPTEAEAERDLAEMAERGFQPDLDSAELRRRVGRRYGNDRAFLRTWAEGSRRGATPAARIALARMNAICDVRDILPTIRVPTLILGQTGDPVMPLDCARDLASRIPGARLVEFDAEAHLPFDSEDEVVATMREWITEAAGPLSTDRFLATVMFVDIVGSTERVARIGDASWRDLLARYYAQARRELALYGGVEVDTAGDGLLAHFDGPGRAIRCARAIERAALALGLECRAGLHTGEVERDNGSVRGIAVHFASRVAALANAGEVLVSSTVRDLVAGSSFTFADRGIHTLKGIPEPRRLLAVEAGA